MALELFKRRAAPSSVSMPVADESEARWERPAEFPLGASASSWGEPEGELALDVYVTPTAVVVRSAMAGVRPEDISISFHNDLLTIRGHRFEEEAVAADRYVVQECHWGTFSRSVILPESVEARGAEAVMRNGVLKVMLPRLAPTPVTVQLSSGDE